MNDVKIIKGSEVICVHPRLSQPIEGVVIALTSEPGKMIGLQLKEEAGFHTCDGRGKDKYCIWVRPEHIMTKEELEASKKVKEDSLVKYQEFEELVLRRS